MKKIFLTVDTECHDINLQNKYIWGTINGKPYGLERILMLGKELDISINFFVDIAECKRYGVQFIKNICDMIEKYGQNVYIHLHPNYISGDDERTFLWQYNSDEQRIIIEETLEYYRELFPGRLLPAFRAGRYGVNKEIYLELYKAFNGRVLDLSYCSPGGKMCHLFAEDVKTNNAVIKFSNCIIFPNTSFICLDFWGINKRMGLDAAQGTIGEFKEVLKSNSLGYIIITMHSWNFIKSFFFIKKKIWAHKSHLRKFRKMVEFAKNNKYQFCDLERDFILEEAIKESDQVQNLSKGFIGKIKSLIRNFIRFQDMAWLSPKYFYFYTSLYGLIVIIVILLLIVVI